MSEREGVSLDVCSDFRKSIDKRLLSLESKLDRLIWLIMSALALLCYDSILKPAIAFARELIK